MFGTKCSIRDRETLDHINFTDKNGSFLYENHLKLARRHSVVYGLNS